MTEQEILNKVNTIGEKISTSPVRNKKTIENKEPQEIEINPLKLYFGDNIVISDKITIIQPVIQDFIDYGEENIYASVFAFTSNSTTLRVQLWDMGIDWNDIDDYSLFVQLIKNPLPEYSHKVFGDIDLSSFNLFGKKCEDGTIVPTLYSHKHDIEIDKSTYELMAKYIQGMFCIKPKVEFAKGKSNKLDCINEDRREMLKKKKDHSSHLLDMISFCLNHSGFKYKKNELREVGLVEFMDSVQRLQIYESTNALWKGMSSGFVDSSKINKEELNFMRSIDSFA